MSSELTLYDSLGNPQILDGDFIRRVNANDPQGVATAWVNFNGITGVILSSYNISGVTKDAVGRYTVSFSTPMDNISFALSGSVAPQDDGVASYLMKERVISTRAVNKVEIGITVNNTSSLYYDAESVSIVIHGGKTALIPVPVAVISPLQLATAWVVFDGTDGSVKSSFNISSVVRDGVGRYTVTFSTPMDNVNYILSGNGVQGDAVDNGDGIITVFRRVANPKSVASFQMTTSFMNASVFDAVDVGVAIHGGKA